MLASEFRQLMALMLLGSSFPGSSGTGASTGLGNLMLPLMMTLLEKLLAEEIQTEAAAEEAEKNSTEVAAPAVKTITGTKKDAVIDPESSPRGRPVDGPITQYSHARHVALDFGIPVGTPIKSTMDGKVIYAGWNNEGYGNLVIVENGRYKTYYAHLSEFKVGVGDTIKANTVVGLSGNTGNSTGPHLHYEVRRDGVPIDPSNFTLV